MDQEVTVTEAKLELQSIWPRGREPVVRFNNDATAKHSAVRCPELPVESEAIKACN